MTFVVGHSPWHADVGLLDFAGQLARMEGESLRVVVVVPDAWPTPVAGDTDRDYQLWSAQQGSSGVAEAERVLADRSPDLNAEVIWQPGRSVPRVLLAQAEEHDATLIIVGSARHGPSGQITVSSKTTRLLHSSPTAVAIVPRAYHAARGSSIERATCAFRGDEASLSTLARSAEICRRTGCELRVVTFGVLGGRMYPPQVSGAEQMVLESWLESCSAAQQRRHSQPPRRRLVASRRRECDGSGAIVGRCDGRPRLASSGRTYRRVLPDRSILADLPRFERGQDRPPRARPGDRGALGSWCGQRVCRGTGLVVC